MLKISETALTNDAATLRMEGEMIGPWVLEVRRAAEQVLATKKRLTLDFAEVAFVDRDGISLLQELLQRKVQLINGSPFLLEQLKEAGALSH